MMETTQKSGRHRILKALFAEAERLGVSQESLRDDISQGVIGRRLSQATAGELIRVLEHIRVIHAVPLVTRKRYESSRQGLIEEIRDIARERFGEDYAAPLNAFCARFGEPDGFRKMRVSQMKVVKQRLLELQKTDSRKPELRIVK